MLRAGPGDAEGVRLLEGVAADELGGDLSGNGDNRDRVHHRVDESGGQVGGAGARGGAADADLTRGAGVAFGCKRRVLFVAHQHVADFVVEENVVQGEGDASGVAEDAIHAFPRQAFQQHLRAAHQRR